MKVAHISDLHFGKGISTQKLNSLIDDIHYQQLDLVLVTGDITDRGTTQQFRQAKRFLDSFGCKYLTVPGNREICFFAPWELLVPSLSMRRYRSFFGKSDKVFYKSDQYKTVFLGLNSVSQFPSWPGSISRDSRYWFKEQAEKHPSHFKVLFLHHPILPVLRASSFWAHQLSDASAIFTICAQTGVQLVLQGHKHRSSVVELRIPETEASLVVSSCGSPLLDRWDSSYHIISIANDMIDIEPREFVKGKFSGKTVYSFKNLGIVNSPPSNS